MLKTRQAKPQIGGRSPWGTIDYVVQLADGIWGVTTPGHGGIKLDRKHNAKIPDYMRRAGGWYEEDCEWVIPGLIFREAFQSNDEAVLKKSFANWYPDAYEKYYGVTLQEGESYIKDQRIFLFRHANAWIVISAIYAKNHPGMVDCTASIGGARVAGFEKRRFLVPESEYDNRNHFGFVIDLQRHKPYSGI